MLLRDTPVRDLMITEVLAFGPDDNVHDAMRALVLRDIDGAPVVDADGRVVGMLSTADLIVEEARIPLPAVITLLGDAESLAVTEPTEVSMADRPVEATHVRVTAVALGPGSTAAVGGLTFLPALALGPIAEHFAQLQGY